MSMRHADVYIGLGSNLDGPAAQVRAAVREIAALPEVRLRAASGLYRSPPMGGPAQPDYVNAAVRVDTGLEPEELLDALQAIERRHGRAAARGHWEARPLDLDLLLWGTRARADARLTLPHPGLHERAFALAPLLELDRALEVPGRGPAAALLERCAWPEARREAPAWQLPAAMRLVAVEGPPGCGKTALCNRLAADFDGGLVLEGAPRNPFLGRAGAGAGLAAQLHALARRVQRLDRLEQADLFRARTFMDFTLAAGDLEAQLALDGDEYDLWLSVHTRLAAPLPKPDLVLLLQEPPPADDARAAELAARAAALFRRWPGAVLTVDAARASPARDEDAYLRLLLALGELEPDGRYFLDPAAAGGPARAEAAGMALN